MCACEDSFKKILSKQQIEKFNKNKQISKPNKKYAYDFCSSYPYSKPKLTIFNNFSTCSI